ncbi:T9SS type A sorting domain-containing protein [Labilibacter sediminis]|nr:T9SS type A sorting domain-containing protein [Labilibacter sediminis]
MKQNYSRLLMTLITLLMTSVSLIAQHPDLLHVQIIDAASDIYAGALTNGTTEEVSYWEGINLKIITDPESITNYRITVELYKDEDTNPYWSKSRFSNPITCFTSVASTPNHSYDSWNDDVENQSILAPPPVPGNYRIKATLTDNLQIPIEGEEPLEISFVITSPTSVNGVEDENVQFVQKGMTLLIKTNSVEASIVRVYNVGGTLKFQKEYKQSEFYVENNFVSGLYLVNVKQGNNEYIYKWMVN